MLVHAEDAERASGLRESVLACLPSASTTLIDARSVEEGELPEADAAVIDLEHATRRGVDAFRSLRARGFTGRVVLVSESPHDASLSQAVNALGNATALARGEVAARPLRLAEALAPADDKKGGPQSSAGAELARTRRVIAAGERALALQHDINNPLAGLLAEVQLLQLDQLTPEQRAATERILELCRRVVVLVRRLDALADQKAKV